MSAGDAWHGTGLFGRESGAVCGSTETFCCCVGWLTCGRLGDPPREPAGGALGKTFRDPCAGFHMGPLGATWGRPGKSCGGHLGLSHGGYLKCNMKSLGKSPGRPPRELLVEPFGK